MAPLVIMFICRYRLSLGYRSEIDFCLETLIQIELAYIKKKNGNIILRDMKDIQEKYNLTNKQISLVINQICTSSHSILDSASYMLAQLNSPNFNTQYNSNPSEALNKLSNQAQIIRASDFYNRLESLIQNNINVDSKNHSVFSTYSDEIDL